MWTTSHCGGKTITFKASGQFYAEVTQCTWGRGLCGMHVGYFLASDISRSFGDIPCSRDSKLFNNSKMCNRKAKRINIWDTVMYVGCTKDTFDLGYIQVILELFGALVQTLAPYLKIVDRRVTLKKFYFCPRGCNGPFRVSTLVLKSPYKYTLHLEFFVTLDTLRSFQGHSVHLQCSENDIFKALPFRQLLANPNETLSKVPFAGPQKKRKKGEIFIEKNSYRNIKFIMVLYARMKRNTYLENDQTQNKTEKFGVGGKAYLFQLNFS